HHIQHSLASLGYNQAQAVRLAGGVRIGELPYFDEGWVSVQDAHAQLAGFLLAPTLQSHGSHQSVLDMCCAPGGKTTHLLEMFHMKHLTATDGDRIRLKRVHENISRLKLDTKDISVVHADGTSMRSHQRFDMI
ncbi:methyltransferase, partial [Moraxella catarrhalis]|uniref:methyltransferase n=1 Tax=Moraxella catarrhalis TaxID=480 RepID=UPI001D0D9512